MCPATSTFTELLLSPPHFFCAVFPEPVAMIASVLFAVTAFAAVRVMTR